MGVLREGVWRPAVARRRTILTCAVLALPIMLTAQASTSLRGLVENSITHQPIARVLVAYGTNSAVLTDNAGRFRLEGLPVGSVSIGYRRPGYFDPVLNQREAFWTGTIDANTPEQILLLRPAANLRGTVSLSDNETPADLRIQLLRRSVQDGRRRWQPSEDVAVQGDGSFFFENLEPGSYLLRAEASPDPAPPEAAPGVRSGYAPVYAPDARNIGAASVFDLRAGQTLIAELAMTRVPYFPVQIHVDGAPNGSFLINGSGFQNWGIGAGHDGLLTAELPSGNYQLVGHSYGQEQTGGELQLHIRGAALSGLHLEMKPEGSFHAEVTGDTGEGPNKLQYLQLMLTPTDSEGQTQYDSLPLTDNGHQIIPTSGNYWIAPMSGGDQYVAELSSGGVDLLRNPLHIAAGANTVITAVLRHDGGILTIKREGPALAQRCTVQVVPLSPTGRFMLLPGMGDLPSYPLQDVPPGEYLLVATASQGEIAFREPGVLQQLRGVRVTVPAGGQAEAKLDKVMSAMELP